MVAVVIFFAAGLALLFFVLGTFFKAMAAALNSILTALGLFFVVGFCAGALMLLLWLIYSIAYGIITQGILQVLGSVATFVICIGLLIVLGGRVGASIVGAVVLVISYVEMIVMQILNVAAALCEAGYVKFLKVILKRLDRC